MTPASLTAWRTEMTTFEMLKTETHQASTDALWQIVRYANVGSEESVIRLVYAKSELRARGFTA